MMRLFLIGIFSVCYATSAVALKLANEDTVVVEAGEDEDWHRVARSESDSDTIEIRSNFCKTPRGKEGMCTTFGECYPNLVPIADAQENTTDRVETYNPGLAEILVNISGICEDNHVRSDIRETDLRRSLRAEVLICCPTTYSPPAPLPPSSGNPPDTDIQEGRDGCGTIRVELKDINGTRIVNGREAQKGEFPWMVALMNNGRQFCGGSLLDKEHVLTAAHCVKHMTQSDVARLSLLIGDHNIYSTTDGAQETRRASKVLYNKGFEMKHLHHDVALIKLSTPVAFTQYIRPICLHSGNTPYDTGTTNADVAGWGQVSDGGTQPQTLRTVNVRVWKDEECKTKYAGKAPAGVGDGMVCAGGTGGDSCRGDSGGPLSIDSKTRGKQIGIVSWGIGCGSYPGVYTRVDKYLAWITKNRKS